MIRYPGGGTEPLARCSPEEGRYLSLKTAGSELRPLGQYHVCLQAAKPHKHEFRGEKHPAPDRW